MNTEPGLMVTEIATVVAVEKNYADVECVSKSACNHCQAASSCGNSSVAKAFGPRQHRFRVRLTEPVAVGQKIKVGLPSKSLIRSALLVYLVPLLLMLVGAIGANLLGSGDGGTLLGAVLGGGCGFFIARYCAQRFDSSRRYQPVMLALADSSDPI